MTSTHAIVLGASLAGSLAAAVLAQHVDQVTVIERDQLPDGPDPRVGVPQARHAHILWSGGARTIDELLPGTIDKLTAAGAHRFGMPSDSLLYTTGGWQRRFPAAQYMITCTRPLIDWVVGQQALANPRITLRTNTEVTNVIGDASRIAGVQPRGRDSRITRTLEADLVVDATGRGSRAVGWLTALGYPAPVEEVVDSGLVYVTRIFQAPASAADGFPTISVLPDPWTGLPSAGGVLLPVEGSRWLVTVGGTRGGEPPTDEDGFARYTMTALRHPIIGELIGGATPLTPIHTTRSTANRRRYYEKLPAWPDGFLVIGDALATYNPVYGHGMSVAAQQAAAINAMLTRNGYRQPITADLQRALARTVEPAWQVAAGQDRQFPNAVGGPPGRLALTQLRYVNRLMKAAAGRQHVCAAFLDVFSLSAPMTRLVSPRIAFGAMLGPGKPALEAPPLTNSELQMLSPGP